MESITRALKKYASKEGTVPIPRQMSAALASADPLDFCHAEMDHLVSTQRMLSYKHAALLDQIAL